MTERTVRITMAEAIVRYLIAQRVIADGVEMPLFPGVIAIFGHGNVTTLGHSLEMHRDEIPVYRGQNEQGMGLAAAAFAKARRRQQIMVCSSSIGPGATNMVTAAGMAMSNRLPVLFLSGDAFVSRLPDPVLQQVEHFGTPSTTVNDAFRPVVRYWDRLVHPAQVMHSLPHAVATMLDPADCGPAFLGLPQDASGDAYDYPERFFDIQVHRIARPRADAEQIRSAAAELTASRRPVIIAGGGVHYSLAESELATFAEKFGIPVVETVAGKSSLPASHPRYAGPIGITGSSTANELVAEADLIFAVGTRLEDFTTGSWTLFDSKAPVVSLNAARFDAVKHRSVAVVGDAREGLRELGPALGDWTADAAWTARGSRAQDDLVTLVADRVRDDGVWPPSYAQVIGTIHAVAGDEDYALTAAGGLPGELNVNWMSKGVATFDCEYGFSCMGYETAGAWGAAMARPDATVYSLVGDGSYLMLNSDIYSSVLSGAKFVLVVCDNGGYAVIERLQRNQGGASYNNMLRDSHGPGSEVRVDFRASAQSLGAVSFEVTSLQELREALVQAQSIDRTVVIVTKVREDDWTESGSFWQIGLPEVSDRPEVAAARGALERGLSGQRRGV